MSFTILFEPGLKPVIKHLQGQHDQKTHGEWADGSVVSYPSKTIDDLYKRRQELWDIQKGLMKKYKGKQPEESSYSKEDYERFYATKDEEKDIEKEIDSLQQEFYDSAIEMKSGLSAMNSLDAEGAVYQEIRDEYVVPDEKTLKTNASLRSTGRVTSKVRRFDSMVELGTIVSPTKVYRGAVLSMEQSRELKVGTSFVDRGFQSTDIESSGARLYLDTRYSDLGKTGSKIMFEYTLQPNINAVNVGYGEIVVQRDAKVTVTGINKKGDIIWVQAEVTKQ